jgi:hypothetical protein
MATPQQHFDASRKWQEHYQKEVEDIGLNIPPPTLGQSTNDYRREMMRLLKKTFIPPTHDLYKMQMRALPADVLSGFKHGPPRATSVGYWSVARLSEPRRDASRFRQKEKPRARRR